MPFGPGSARVSTRSSALLALLIVPGAGCARGAAKSAQPPAMPVKIELARSVAVDDTTEYVATLKSRESAVIMPQVEGDITEILVRSGQRVAPGEALMQIDPAKQDAALKSQQDTRTAKLAALEFARQQYERVTGLQAAGVVSQHDLDQAKSALDAAQAELQSLDAQVREQQVQLRYHRVTAPTAGIVGDIPVRVGDRVTTSTVLTTVDQQAGLEAYVQIPIERAPEVRTGLPVRLMDSRNAVLAETAIDFVSPQVDDRTQSVLVKAPVAANQGFRTEQFVRALVVWRSEPGLTVPTTAVTRINGQFFAFVAEPDKQGFVARQHAVKVGELRGNEYVLLGGLKAGDRLIVSGTQKVADGAPVAPQG